MATSRQSTVSRSAEHGCDELSEQSTVSRSAEHGCDELSEQSAVSRSAKHGSDELSETSTVSRSAEHGSDELSETFRRSTFIGSDAEYDHSCDLCILDNEVKEAKAFCTVCVQYLCAGCHKAHSRANVSRTHNVLVGKDMPVGNTQVKYAPKCDKHPDSDLDTFCHDHKSVCCPKCIVLAHGGCGNVEKLSQLSNKQNKADNKVKLDSLKSILNEFLRIQGVCNTLKSDLQTLGSDIKKKIKNDRRRLDKLLDKLESETLAKTDEYTQTYVADLERQIYGIDCFVDELTHKVADHNDKLDTGSDNEIIVTSITMEHELQRYSTGVQQFYDNVYQTDMTFTLDKRLHKLCHEISEFGSIRLDRAKADIQRQFIERQAVFLRDMDVKLQSGEEIKIINDIQILSDGKLLFCPYDPPVVQLYDTSYRLLSELKISSKIRGMVEMSPQNIILALFDEQCFQSVSIKCETLELSGRCKPKHRYWRLAKIENNMVAVWWDTDFTYIDIIDQSGRRIRKVRKEPKKDGLFPTVARIRVSEDNTIIYITSPETGLTGLSLNGDIVLRFQEETNKGYAGLCTLPDRSICLCGYQVGNVLTVNPSDKTSNEIIKLKGREAGCVAYRKECNVLIVFMFKGPILKFVSLL